ncbi:MAG: PorT family protein [Muribaculaceae bacterium]|nr:PorT family protein [Muribaculaceae bacterium]
MKNKILAILAVLLTFGAVSAEAQMRRGASVGVDISSLTFKQELISVDQTVGPAAGLQYELMFPGIGFGLDFGLAYAQRGANLHLGDCRVWAADGFGNERAFLHYLQIPVHFRFKYTNLGGIEDVIAPFVYGGPEFSILFGHGSIKRNGQSALKYAGGDLGIAAGGGVELFKRWQLSVSYTWGMTYSLKTRLLDDFSARNRTWSVRAVYFF